VQEFELILIAAAILGAVAYLVARSLRRGNGDHVVGRLLLGLIPAAIGLAAVLISRFDLVPDEVEGSIWTIGVVVVSAALVLGTSYRLARR
jgi:hypothetical protein